MTQNKMAAPVKFPAPLNPQEMNRPLEFPAPQTFSNMTQSSCPNFLPFWFSLSQILNGIMGRGKPVGTPGRALLSHDKVAAFSYQIEEAVLDLHGEVCIFGDCFCMTHLFPGF